MNYLTIWDGGESVGLMVLLHFLSRGGVMIKCALHTTPWCAGVAGGNADAGIQPHTMFHGVGDV